MFWSAISSSSDFSSVGFENSFISFISFGRFWNKTKLCVHSSPGCLTGLLGVIGWADRSSGELKFFPKNNDSGVSVKTKISDSEKGGHWLVSSARFGNFIFFCFFDFIRILKQFYEAFAAHVLQ